MLGGQSDHGNGPPLKTYAGMVWGLAVEGLVYRPNFTVKLDASARVRRSNSPLATSLWRTASADSLGVTPAGTGSSTSGWSGT